MTRTIKTGIRAALLAVAASAALVACGGGGGSGPAAPATGTLRVALTDAPACGFVEVNVTVERVRFHMSASAGDNDAGWVDIVVSPARTLNLLNLMNGVVAELGQTNLPAGQYTQVRLVLAPNRNTVMPDGMGSMPLDTPSGTQSGLKLTPGFTVTPNQLTDLVIDFDACRSIVQRGNGSYGLKPVLSVIPRTGAAIQGYVQAGVTGVTVSAQKNGVVFRATQPDSTGFFVLAPVNHELSPYDVVFTAPSSRTSVVTNVQAAANTTTTLGTDLSRIQMPTSTNGAVDGRVTLSGSATTPSVRAIQNVTSTLKVEVAHKNADLAGNYSLSLPLLAPLTTPYANPLGAFTSQDAAAGKYDLEASAMGYQTATRLNVSAPATGQDFTLLPPP
jgi:hypothetical protein